MPATCRLRGLKRLLPLPWANSTIPGASFGIARSPSRVVRPAGICTARSDTFECGTAIRSSIMHRLNRRGIGFWYLATIPPGHALQRFDCARPVKVEDRIELIRKACAEVVAKPFSLGPIHDTNRPLQPRLAQAQH